MKKYLFTLIFGVCIVSLFLPFLVAKKKMELKTQLAHQK